MADEPKKGEIVPTEEVDARTLSDQNSIPYQLMDSYDDELVLADIKGIMASSELAEKWVYEFPQEGKTIRGLSWVGTKELRYWFAKKGSDIITELPEFHKLEEKSINGKLYLDCTVAYEIQFKDGRKVRTTATVRQGYSAKRSRAKGGGEYDLDAAFVPRIAESKAQRNAIQKLIPAATLSEFISYAVKQNKVQTLALSRTQIELTPEEMKIAAPFYSEIEQLQNVAELRAYYIKVDGMTKELDAKITIAIKRAVEIKGVYLTNLAAAEKVKAMSEKKK
jgi:hypothetical protein